MKLFIVMHTSSFQTVQYIVACQGTPDEIDFAVFEPDTFKPQLLDECIEIEEFPKVISDFINIGAMVREYLDKNLPDPCFIILPLASQEQREEWVESLDHDDQLSFRHLLLRNID